MRAIIAPAEAIFLDAKFEADLAEMDDDEMAHEMLAEMGITESGLDQLARVGFDTLGLQTYLTAGPKETRAWTITQGRHRPRGRRRHPHRLPEGLHQGRDRLLRRPDVRRHDAQGQGGRQGAHGGQGLRHGRRRRGGVPLQRLIPSVLAGQSACGPCQSTHSAQELRHPKPGSCSHQLGSAKGGDACIDRPITPNCPRSLIALNSATVSSGRVLGRRRARVLDRRRWLGGLAPSRRQG